MSQQLELKTISRPEKIGFSLDTHRPIFVIPVGVEQTYNSLIHNPHSGFNTGKDELFEHQHTLISHHIEDESRNVPRRIGISTEMRLQKGDQAYFSRWDVDTIRRDMKSKGYDIEYDTRYGTTPESKNVGGLLVKTPIVDVSLYFGHFSPEDKASDMEAMIGYMIRHGIDETPLDKNLEHKLKYGFRNESLVLSALKDGSSWLPFPTFTTFSEQLETYCKVYGDLLGAIYRVKEIQPEHTTRILRFDKSDLDK
jgi:hypothetical protein